MYIVPVSSLLTSLSAAPSPQSITPVNVSQIPGSAMVPLMMATLAVVVGSQIVGVGQEIGSLLAVVPVYAAFLLLMVPVGLAAARMSRLDPAATRAVVFSGATRNSLVVLPLALALPGQLALASLVVVTQTLVELIGMVLYVRFLPLIVPTEPRRQPA